MLKQCACCSGNVYVQCCEPLLTKATVAKTPVELMRSRFSAFALGGFGQYLLNTWGVAGSMGLSEPELSTRSHNWQGLQIVSDSQQGDHGHVEFKAVYLDANNKLGVHHEHSTFERIDGRWYYINGDVFS